MFIENKFELETEVVSCEKVDNEFVIVLKDTVFYPEGGGQLSDSGYIGDAFVNHVYKKDGIIYHVATSEVSGQVFIKIDEDKRYKHSLIHSSQHLVSAVFDKDKADTSSVNMNDNGYTFTLSKEYTREELDLKELEVNDYIKKGLKIQKRLYDEVKDKEVEVYDHIAKDKLTLVEIDGLDKNLCGGTHISNTSEIFYIRFLDFKCKKGTTKLRVVCGDDAIKEMQNKFNSFEEVRTLYGVNENDVLITCVKKMEELKNLKKENNDLRNKIRGLELDKN